MIFFALISIVVVIWLVSISRLRSRLDRLTSQHEELGVQVLSLRDRIRHLETAAQPPAEPEDQPLPAAAAAPATPPAPSPPQIAEPAISKPPLIDPDPIPREPSAADRIVSGLRAFLFEGNPIVKAGVVVLFFGVSFLLRFAAEQGAFPIEARLLAAASGGLALLVLGWLKRLRAGGFGTALQGGGIGVLYLTAFAASRLYEVMPLGFAFAFLFALTLLGVLLAVKQATQWLAVLAIAGGFLAPILTSTGQGSHVVLFGYYAVLNLGILAVVWFRSWRLLNWVGFAFTWVIGVSWGVTSYHPDQFATTEPFLVFFFLMYVTVGAVFALRQTPHLKGFIDVSMVFGTPVVAFAAQSALVRDTEFGLALSAAFAGAVYVGFTRWLWTKGGALRAIAESYLALAVTFLTLAIPFALDDQAWTGAAWALEGAAMVWIGVRQGRRLARYTGMALQLLAAGLYMLSVVTRPDSAIVLINSVFLCGVFVGLGGFITAYILRGDSGVRGRLGTRVALAWGQFWLLLAILLDVFRFYPAATALLWLLVGWSLAFVAQRFVGERLEWPMLLRSAQAHVYLGVFLAMVDYSLGSAEQPLAAWGALGWLVFFATHVFLLRRLEAPEDTAWLRVSHAAGLHVLLFLAAWSLSSALSSLEQLAPVWSTVAWGAVPLSFLAVLQMSLKAPFVERYSWSYRWHGTLPAQIFLVGWVLLVLGEPADPAPLPFVPVINPLEVTQLLIVVFWLSSLHRVPGLQSSAKQVAVSLIAAIGLLSLTAAVARAVHHLLDVRYNLDDLLASAAFQTSITIVWTSLALVAMVTGNRQRRRGLWIGGAGLLALVVLKLFAVDLSGVATVARIVSFLTAGVLMLLIGYFSPLPPRAAAMEREEPS